VTEKKKSKGTVQSIDSFGNLITNIPADALVNVASWRRRSPSCATRHETHGIFNAYADQPEMTLIAPGRFPAAIWSWRSSVEKRGP